MMLVESSYYQYADDTSPCIGRKLGMTNVVEVQNSSEGGVNWKPQIGKENSFIKSYFAWASRQYCLTLPRDPGLDPGWK